jgi:hypothetical protein
MGIEPTLAAWEAAVLPLNYTRMIAGTPPAPADRRGRESADSSIYFETRIFLTQPLPLPDSTFR